MTDTVGSQHVVHSMVIIPPFHPMKDDNSVKDNSDGDINCSYTSTSSDILTHFI